MDGVPAFPEPIIRRAQIGDCEQIASLAVQLGYPSSAQEIESRLTKMQDNQSYAVYVAELAGGVLGGWIGVCVCRSVEAAERAEISGLVVHEEMRSQQIGQRLVEAAEDWSRSVGCDEIRVRSNVIRDRAHSFYIRNGYREAKVQKQFRKRLTIEKSSLA
jgi:GNAT superfamily N-acetyltransferase